MPSLLELECSHQVPHPFVQRIPDSRSLRQAKVSFPSRDVAAQFVNHRSGREFAAWIGLVPAQTGTGGKVKLLGISKRGDIYLRTLLIHGARAVLAKTNAPSPWLQELGKRRPPNVVIVALENKMARTFWAVLAHGRAFDKEHVSVRPSMAAPT